MSGRDARTCNSHHKAVSPYTIGMCLSAAMVSETVTYPLDMIKTRVQVFGELKRGTARPGILRLSLSLIQSEGFLKLWQGLSPALIRHLIYTGSRVPLYELIRQDVFHLPPAAHSTITSKAFISAELQPNQDFSFIVKAALAGVLAGGTAQFLASPADLIKVRLQTENRWKSESRLAPQMRQMAPTNNLVMAPMASPRSTFVGCFRQIFSEGGLVGLWRGGLPNVQRAALVNMGELTTYDTAKRWFAVRFQLPDGPLLHLCASGVSGFVAAILGTPADLVKTRIMNQRASSVHGQMDRLLYTGVMDCLRKVVLTEGFFALYKGFFLIWARMAPWSLTFWLTYEKIRIVSGVGGF